RRIRSRTHPHRRTVHPAGAEAEAARPRAAHRHEPRLAPRPHQEPVWRTTRGPRSDRIMNRFGDTPLGMVESALEFAHISRKHDFHNFKFSMKSSNPKVMIQCYRLLVARLEQEGRDWNYPIHLGVTEAGDGEDGRIKSAIGIGSLLCDGLGDTIRVSLTEDSPREIEVCRDLLV